LRLESKLMARQSSAARGVRTRVKRSQVLTSEKPSAVTEEAIKAAEDVALAAFASGLKLAAAFGTVAAKTTSFALESLAIGADKFSDLVSTEAMKSPRTRPSSVSKRKRRERASVEK
jgi:hypothetical protein